MSIVSYAESSPYTTDSRVSGLIEVGGRVEVHADGMRAERARPIALILPAGLPEEEAARIILAAERHEAELLDVEWFGLKGLLEWCSRHAPPLAVGFIGELTGQQPEDAGFGIDDMAGARKRKMKRALRSGLAQAVARGPAGRPAPRPETWWVLRPIEWAYERLVPVVKLIGTALVWLFVIYVCWVACLVLYLGLAELLG